MHISGLRPVGSRLRLPLLLLLLGTSAAVAPPLAAQDAARDCRCVDRDGNPIESCACIRTPPARALQLFGVPGPRARIGVALEEDAGGARIAEVMEGSPAAAAGLLVGDVITRVDGRSLQEPLPDATRERAIDPGDGVAVQRLMALAHEWEPGTPVELEIVRGGERRTLGVEPERAPGQGFTLRTFGGGAEPGYRFFGPDGRFEMRVDSLLRRFDFDVDSVRVRVPPLFRADSLAPATVFRFADGCGGVRGRLTVFEADCVDGAHLAELNADLGAYFGASRGVLVTRVEADSRLGLRPGDVILAIGLRAVETPDQVARILASYGADEDVPMRILRRGEELEVQGRRR